jgi:hypothetical protein
MDSIEIDEEGMMVCALHKQRRYGWRSHGRNWDLARLTPFDLENVVVFRIPPKREKIEYGDFRVEDIRDNRDPESVWLSSEGQGEIRRMRGSYQPEHENGRTPSFAGAAAKARKRLDIKDRTGWPVLNSSNGKDELWLATPDD